MKRSLNYLTCLLLTASCTEFLNEKPDRALAIPNSLQDLQAILDNETRNSNLPDAGDIGSDYYYLDDRAWNGMNETIRANYSWLADLPPATNNWYLNYQRIFDANVVLEAAGDMDGIDGKTGDIDRIKGEAYFLRGWMFCQLAQLFSPPFGADDQNTPLGIPLRLTPDINDVSYRSTVTETYRQIISDLNAAVQLLPDASAYKTRPGKAAAYAALSRTYLAMRDYESAFLYADSCLAIHNALLDYNQLDSTKSNPFEPLNAEVIYHARFFSIPLFNSTARVDSNLYSLYDEADLRKQLFYHTNNAGVTGFYGDYSGSVSGPSFAGIATDEILLTRAECLVRMGRIDEGVRDLNMLLRNRISTDAFHELSFAEGHDALDRILIERRKELAFRGGIRWMDLRRLNKEGRHEERLIRRINGEEYILEPNDARYTWLIPFEVVQITGMAQNPR
ncbi:RagB/SusD family nutrient uptake outer membrane protein [Parapedobacter sp. ISTM3]|uniref:RagB/SusD family nutrient uptake outer membrane protein n=1 Tax=Parapedobacter sp. ISTM3 TaxID=2800130 RepID=UPI00190489C9|nr:RagB/SusD family nutrient uptake outer membrane protein [Parapedobacter sp. ISTM3]MBK1442667.1 RagB/SusD family nutrient uptake outer membrane protein [Parapedobacter sp. ISTM3]